MRTPISWNNLWMNMAFLVAERSKDPNTQCGAVIVSPDNRQVSIGYNGFPKKIEDTELRWQRPTKYDLVIHAERNAILNSKKDLSGWTLYVTMVPCHLCSLDIIQSGIKKIIYANEPPNPLAYKYELSISNFREAGVEVIKFKDLEVK